MVAPKGKALFILGRINEILWNFSEIYDSLNFTCSGFPDCDISIIIGMLFTIFRFAKAFCPSFFLIFCNYRIYCVP